MEEDKRTWEKKDVFALISEWKDLPELWDPKNNFYRNRARKQKAVELLAKKFGTNVNEINRKLHNLRTQVHSEIRRAKRRREAGGDFYQSSWDFFEALKFIWGMKSEILNNEVSEKVLKREVESQEINEVSSFGSDNFTGSEDKNMLFIGNTEIIDPSNPETQLINQICIPENCKRKILDDSTSTSSTGLPDIRPHTVTKINKDEDEDEFDIFAKYIAIQLKQMPLYDAIICQEQIQAVIKKRRLLVLSKRHE